MDNTKQLERNNRIIKRSDIKKIKKKLIAEYGYRCAYCNTPILGPETAYIDHYYPRAYNGELDWNEDNLILCCSYCNLTKSNKAPVSRDGKVLILHPYFQKYSKHMAQNESGELVGITEEGNSTISYLRLNRPELTEYRKKYPDDFPFFLIDPKRKPVNDYNESIKSIKALLELELPNQKMNEYFLRIMFGNVVTAMEAYLSKIVLTLITYNEELKWQCVKKYDWNKQKVEMNEIRDTYLSIDLKLITELEGILYHNLVKVKMVLDKCFDIDILDDNNEKEYMTKAMSIRHNIVHRNGRNLAKDIHEKKVPEYIVFSKDDILELINHTNKLVIEIETQIKEKKYILVDNN